MCDHVRATVEARLKKEMARTKQTTYNGGYTDALMWVLDLIDFSKLDPTPDG